jgi:hypothetical protein
MIVFLGFICKKLADDVWRAAKVDLLGNSVTSPRSGPEGLRLGSNLKDTSVIWVSGWPHLPLTHAERGFSLGAAATALTHRLDRQRA